jgi:hypothetical protein
MLCPTNLVRYVPKADIDLIGVPTRLCANELAFKP